MQPSCVDYLPTKKNKTWKLEDETACSHTQYTCFVDIYMCKVIDTTYNMYVCMRYLGFFQKIRFQILKISGNLKKKRKNDGSGGVPSIWLIREHNGYD